METHFENIEQAHGTMARQRVLADLRALAHDSETLLKVTAGDVGEKAKEAQSRLAAALTRAKSTCDAMQEQTRATAKAVAQGANVVIRQRPYESVSLAFSVGLLVGLWIMRK
jgi:ElaB/YqjD/DUF883 family membrane-anchored ribosome-binding protein